MTTLHLVDAFAHIYRGYYANPNLTNGAAFFFTRNLMAAMRLERPTHLACVFDVDRGSRYRYALHPAYKAGRNERPAGLDIQLPMIKDIVDFMHWNRVELQGAEADDVIATLATRAVREGFDKVVIMSPDKDLLQLVDDAKGISCLAERDGILTHLRSAEVVERLGVKPAQVVDYLTLVGDTSDNVPGVQGIGEKGAAGLLEQYGNLSGILAHRQDLRKPYREGLQQALPLITRNRHLVTVIKDLDLRLPKPMLTGFACPSPSPAEMRKFFTDIKFPSLAPERTLEELDPALVGDVPTFDDL